MATRRDKLGAAAQQRERYHTLHCPVLNYLLDVRKGGTPARRRREEAFRVATWTAQFAFNDETPELHPDVVRHKTGRDFHRALSQVDGSLKRALLSLHPFVEWQSERAEALRGEERDAAKRATLADGSSGRTWNLVHKRPD